MARPIGPHASGVGRGGREVVLPHVRVRVAELAGQLLLGLELLLQRPGDEVHLPVVHADLLLQVRSLPLELRDVGADLRELLLGALVVQLVHQDPAFPVPFGKGRGQQGLAVLLHLALDDELGVLQHCLAVAELVRLRVDTLHPLVVPGFEGLGLQHVMPLEAQRAQHLRRIGLVLGLQHLLLPLHLREGNLALALFLEPGHLALRGCPPG
mmetsp:Transcript_17587/g.45324  ORF Transcript_17587/g.45324 Transcript_17587/m.45324 type:complete len:211 (-) Transcript_17587:2407-3039(-)